MQTVVFVNCSPSRFFPPDLGLGVGGLTACVCVCQVSVYVCLIFNNSGAHLSGIFSRKAVLNENNLRAAILSPGILSRKAVPGEKQPARRYSESKNTLQDGGSWKGHNLRADSLPQEHSPGECAWKDMLIA